MSNIGTWMQRVAQDWLVLELTHSGTALGIVIGLQFLPALVWSPYAGLIADRLDKRQLLIMTQVALAVVSSLLGSLAMMGVVQIWHVYVLASLVGIGTAFEVPVRQSLVVETVDPNDLSNAVGLFGASFSIARVIGPALAGVLIHRFGTGPVILANGLSYLAAVASLLLMHPADLRTALPAVRGKGMIRESIRYLWRQPELMMVIATVFFAGAFGLNFQVASALMATAIFSKGAQGFGILGSTFALGSLIGALLAARRARPQTRMVSVAAVALGLIEIIAGRMPTYLAFVLVLPLMGLAAMTMLNTANATMQLAAESTMRGRVMALYMTVLMGSTTIGSPVIGWIGQAVGPRWTLIVGGGLTVLGAVGSSLVFFRLVGCRFIAHQPPPLDVLQSQIEAVSRQTS